MAQLISRKGKPVRLRQSPVIKGRMGGHSFTAMPAPSAPDGSPYEASYRSDRGIYVHVSMEEIPKTKFEIMPVGNAGEQLFFVHIPTPDAKKFLDAAEYAIGKLARALGLYPIWHFNCHEETYAKIGDTLVPFYEVLNARAGHRGVKGIMKADTLRVISLEEATFTTPESQTLNVVFELWSNGDVYVHSGHISTGFGGDDETIVREPCADELLGVIAEAIRAAILAEPLLRAGRWELSHTFGIEHESVFEGWGSAKGILPKFGFSNFR